MNPHYLKSLTVVVENLYLFESSCELPIDFLNFRLILLDISEV